MLLGTWIRAGEETGATRAASDGLAAGGGGSCLWPAVKHATPSAVPCWPGGAGILRLGGRVFAVAGVRKPRDSSLYAWLVNDGRSFTAHRGARDALASDRYAGSAGVSSGVRGLPRALPPLRPAAFASAGVNRCARPLSCDALPPWLARSRCWAGSSAAKPRGLFGAAFGVAPGRPAFADGTTLVDGFDSAGIGYEQQRKQKVTETDAALQTRHQRCFAKCVCKRGEIRKKRCGYYVFQGERHLPGHVEPALAGSSYPGRWRVIFN